MTPIERFIYEDNEIRNRCFVVEADNEVIGYYRRRAEAERIVTERRLASPCVATVTELHPPERIVCEDD